MASKKYRTLFVMDPIASVLVDHDGTFSLMLEAQSRHHAIAWCDVQDLSLSTQTPQATVQWVEVKRKQGDHYRLLKTETIHLDQFDFIWMRKDPPVDANYLYATQVLDLVARKGTAVFNRPATLRSRNEKLFILDFPQIIPSTLVSAQRVELETFVRSQSQGSILKPLNGFGGRAIFKTHPQDPNLGVILETLTERGRTPIMAQEYLNAVQKTGDKRIIVIDGRAVGAMARMPSSSDHRANMAAGGTPKAISLDPQDLKIVETIGDALRSEGILFAGIDVIGDRLTEINITSPTGIQEIDRFHGIHCAQLIWDLVEKSY